MENIFHITKKGEKKFYQFEKNIHSNYEINSECWIGVNIQEKSKKLLIKKIKYNNSKVLRDMAFETMCRVRTVVKRIPEVYDFWEDKNNKCIYIVMEYINGMTLDEWIKKHKDDVLIPQFVKYRFVFIRELCSIMHKIDVRYKGVIVHKDLKPENIIIVNKNRKTDIFLIDFGTAFTYNVRNLGTPKYQAPEQMGRRGTSVSISAKTDIFAIGQMIFELMTGEVPIIDIDYIVSPGKRKWSKMPSIIEKVPDLPYGSEIEALVKNMVMFDPQDRYGYTDILSELIRIFNFR